MQRMLAIIVAGAAVSLLIALNSGAQRSAAQVAAARTPTWSDEFDGPEGAPPDPATWALRTGGRWRHSGRLELQCYTKRPENVSQDGLGHLRITARSEPASTYCADGPNDYTSARLDSRRLKTFQYGRIEARIKLPTAAGAWPAWWMAGATGTWPASGEIDILEHRPGLEPDAAYHALLGDRTSGTHWSQRATVTGVGGGEWHTYGIDWTKDRIDFQVDGVTTWTRSPADIPADANWPFDDAFGLLLNVAVGNWGGTPDPAQFPAAMLVDWVRVDQDGEPAPAPEPTPTPEPTPSGSDPVVAVAGDVAAGNDGSRRTAPILEQLGMDAVLMAGDGAYPDGSAADYARYYEPTWGPFKALTYPVPGNHEYHVADAAGYFDYFGERAGERSKGWYSFDLGAWHLIALNSSRGCSPVPCRPGSEQYEWLRADLAAHPNRCTLAFWHHPRWSQGNYQPGTAAVAPLWDLLYDEGADLVFSGHDHDYQRFAPLDKSGAPDLGRGIRSFVVGTGGAVMYAVDPPGGTLEASQSGTLGVLAVTLRDGGYDWEFVPESGKTYTDAGGGTCH
jgi:beta-glucanase (GH16 family)